MSVFFTHVSYITWDKSIATIIFSYFPKNWESKIKLGRNNPHKTSFFLKVLSIRGFSPEKKFYFFFSWGNFWETRKNWLETA
jgi:hypothetical protein